MLGPAFFRILSQAYLYLTLYLYGLFATNNTDWVHYTILGLTIVAFLASILDVVWVAFDSKRQALHDKIAKTYCVRLNR